MNIRDLFTANDDAQRKRVDGPSIREVATLENQELFGTQEEWEAPFRGYLPGEDNSKHPGYQKNPYLYVPGSELEYLLKNKKNLSTESRKRIVEALKLQR